MLQNTDNENVKTAVEIEVQRANAFEIDIEANIPINTTNNRHNQHDRHNRCKPKFYGAGIYILLGTTSLCITISIIFILMGKKNYYDPSYTCIPGYTPCDTQRVYSREVLCFNNNDTTALSACSIYDTISCGNFCSYRKNIIKPIVTENPFRDTGIAWITVGSILLISTVVFCGIQLVYIFEYYVLYSNINV